MAQDDFLEKMGDFISRGAQKIRDRLTFDITDLIRAVGKNDVDGLIRVLEAGVDPDGVDILNRRALCIAVDANSLEMVSLLLAAGANPNLSGKTGELPLSKAIFWENKPIIAALIKAGADGNIKDDKGRTAIELSKTAGFGEWMENLNTAQKKEKNATDLAIHERQRAQAEKAKKERARNEQLAKEKAQSEAQSEAYQKYPRGAANPLQALIESIRHSDEEAMAIFLLKVEDLNAYDEFFKTTPLLEAINAKNALATGLLLEKGANPLLQHKQLSHSGFTLAIKKSAYGLVAKILDDEPAACHKILADPSIEISPQFLAYKDSRMFNLLIKGGADPYFGGTLGQSPIVKAISKGGLGILPVLVRNNISLEKEVEGKTPLQWAIHYNRMDWVNGLIAEKVTVNEELISEAEGMDDRVEIINILKAAMD